MVIIDKRVDYTDINQELYNQIIDDVEMSKVRCTCGKDNCVVKMGKYRRWVKSGTDKTKINVQRVICKKCGKSHVLLPSIFVPYSMIDLKGHLALIDSYFEKRVNTFLDDNPLVDRSNINYHVKKYQIINCESNCMMNNLIKKYNKYYKNINIVYYK